MLESRIITPSSSEILVSVTAIKGCPQGGVFFPLLWILVIDNLLVELHNFGYYAIGYADDLLVFISGKHEETIISIMQRIIKGVFLELENFKLK